MFCYMFGFAVIFPDELVSHLVSQVKNTLSVEVLTEFASEFVPM